MYCHTYVPCRHPLSERSFFLSFLLSFYFVSCLWCPVRPCMHSCFLCACVRGAWLFVACCARSPGRVLRLRCEGGNLSPFGLLKGARRALVSTLLFALVITEFLHLSSLFLHVQHSHRSWMRAERGGSVPRPPA